MLAYSRKLKILLAFHLCWGVALWLSISKYGLGVSSDSTAYMFAGASWIQGKGLSDYSGAPYFLWPPLYPMLIGFLHLAGLSAFAAAHVIQFGAFAFIAYFSSIYFLKIFEADFRFAVLGAVLLDTGPVVISTFYMIGTDYVFLLFPILLALLINEYAETQKPTTLVLLGLTVSISMLTRYLGYTLLLTALLAVLVYSRGSALKRFQSAATVAVFSIPPFLWMVYTWLASAALRRAPLSFGEYFSQFTLGILSWFTADLPNAKKLAAPAYVAIWGTILIGVILLFVLARKTRVFSPLISSTLGFGLIYLIGLFGNALTAYFNRLWGRFQLPFYFPLLVLFLTLISLGSRHLRQNNPRAFYLWAVTGFTFLVILGLLQLNITRGLMRDAYASVIPENWINTREIDENSILQYWKKNTPGGEYRLIANYAELVAFQTQHETVPSPRRSGLYDTTIIPIEGYRNTLFPDSRDVYLVWIEPNNYENVYLPSEYAPIAEVELLAWSRDGAIYLLRPAH